LPPAAPAPESVGFSRGPPGPLESSGWASRGRLELRGTLVRLRNATFKLSSVMAQYARALLELRNAIIEFSNARAPSIRAFVHVRGALLKLRHGRTHDGSALLEVRDARLGIRGAIL
jgi:hypothetical protein